MMVQMMKERKGKVKAEKMKCPKPPRATAK